MFARNDWEPKTERRKGDFGACRWQHRSDSLFALRYGESRDAFVFEFPPQLLCKFAVSFRHAKMNKMCILFKQAEIALLAIKPLSP